MNSPQPARHRIIIVGGGAGGLPLAVRLGDKLGRNRRAEITLIDRFATHLWKPLLHEVAAGRVDADVHGVDYLALAYWHHFRFRQGIVAGLDRAKHELTLNSVFDDDGVLMLPRRVLRYDTLVFCVGSTSNDFDVPGVAAHAISLDTLVDAERFHRRLLAACVRADAEAAPGGPAGGGTGLHRARGKRRRTGGRDPTYDRRPRELRPGLPRPGEGHPANRRRGRAAHPAPAIRTCCRGGNRIAAKARRRRAHRGARNGG